VDSVASRVWPTARAADEDDAGVKLRELWALAAEQGWLSLADDDVLDAAIGAAA